MPMIDIQRRHQTIFRIRFGEKNGKFPTKLTDSIRVTSPNPAVVDAFIDVYGGQRKPWEGTQWEAKLPTTALNILVLPGQSISQWWEKYRGSVCDRRCDGAIETKSGKACWCDPDVEKRTANKNDCDPTTRVSVLCPDVAVVGSGMFVCHGLVGAETLPQSIAVAEAALSRGLMVPAVLRVVEFRGRNHFIVPQIEVVGVSFNALTAAAHSGQLEHITRGPEARAAIDAPAVPFTPVPVEQLPAPPTASTRDQLAARPAPKPRANAAVPIPSTGIRPRGAGHPPTGDPPDGAGTDGTESLQTGSGDVPVPSVTTVTEPDASASPAPSAPGRRGNDASTGTGSSSTGSSTENITRRGATPDDAAGSAPLNDASRVAMWCNDAGIGDDRRAALLHAFSGGAYSSAKDVPSEQLGALRDVLDKIKAGRVHLMYDPGHGEAPVLRGPDLPAVEPGPEPAAIQWRALIADVPGIGPAKLLTQARVLAEAQHLELPRSIEEIPPALNTLLREWLVEQSAAA